MNSPSSGPLLSITSGATAGLLATGFTQPFDVIKTRIQLDPKDYRNLWYGGKKILNVESWVLGIDNIGRGSPRLFQGNVAPVSEEGHVRSDSMDWIRRNIKGDCQTEDRNRSLKTLEGDKWSSLISRERMRNTTHHGNQILSP